MAKIHGHPTAAWGNTEEGEAQLTSWKRSPDQDMSSEEARQGHEMRGTKIFSAQWLGRMLLLLAVVPHP